MPESDAGSVSSQLHRLTQSEAWRNMEVSIQSRLEGMGGLSMTRDVRRKRIPLLWGTAFRVFPNRQKLRYDL